MAQIYCTYCGKGFSRKEHLERHIPTHTNVKPHRCSQCQLSFARRDLLQRHHSTYHEDRDPMEPHPGGVPTVAGRTPIACQNCANAKTGCDKRVPCTRCAEKNIPCAARFARRSSKAAVRAAQASTAFPNQLAPAQQPISLPQTVNPSLMEIDQPAGMKSSLTDINTPSGMEALTSMDSRFQEASSKKSTPQHPHIGTEEFTSPPSRLDGLDEFIPVANSFLSTDGSYQEMLFLQPDYNLDLDIYSGPLPLATRSDMTITPFADLSTPTNSEPMASSSSRISEHTRGTSIISMGDYDGNHLKAVDACISEAGTDFQVVIAAEAAWPLARCNPAIYSGTCPRTAIVHLECLERNSKQENTWSSLEKYLEQVDWDASDLASVVPLTSGTRDKMLAITQSFLHKALEIHRGGISSGSKAGYASPRDCNFIVLPPPKIVEYFLRSYVRSLSVYYPLVAAGCVDPNEMLQNNQASTLLVLLMIAQGAAAMPMDEARYLAAGLTETCRISLFDIIEKDVELSADPVALRCALLFTVLGAWSGDKWLMDIAMGQRGMYLTMLKHAGMMEPQPTMAPNIDSAAALELHWRAWMHRESQNRLVYNWAMVDQELSLFYDTAPILSITELQCPLPSLELFWMAPDAEQWFSRVRSVYGFDQNVTTQMLSSPALNPSLLELFQDFLHENLSRRQNSLTPQQLRLLLHPLQSMLFHLRQLLSCFSDGLEQRRLTTGVIFKGQTFTRLEEVHNLLRKWYELTEGFQEVKPDCPVTRCNLVLYHLVSLNTVTNFPEIERLARRENCDNAYWEIAMRHKRCILQREETIMHCGQVFKLLRLMAPDRRPNWWAAAVYRATLILWADSVLRLGMEQGLQPDNVVAGTCSKGGGLAVGGIGNNSTGSGSGVAASIGLGAGAISKVAIDQLMPNDPVLTTFVWNGEGLPELTRSDGTMMGLEKPAEVLSYGIQTLEDTIRSRMVDGIRRKLMTLGKNWNLDGLGAGA